jgi:membrane associated rhomboid family serine protease
MRNLPPVTLALLVANVLVFLLQKAGFDTLLIVYLGLWPIGMPERHVGDVVIGFAPWQLVTYGFLHGNLPHIVLNGLALYMFGAPLERLWGSRPFALYYFLAVIGAAIAQLIVVGVVAPDAQPTPTNGASGGVFGLLLGFGMMYPHAKIMPVFPPIPMPAWLFVILYGAIELMFGITGTASGIAHFAHLGGMATGLVMILYWRGKLPIKPRRRLMR